MSNDPPESDDQAVLNANTTFVQPNFTLRDSTSGNASGDGENGGAQDGSASATDGADLQAQWPTFVDVSTEAVLDTSAAGQGSMPTIGDKLGGGTALNTLPLNNLRLNPALRLPDVVLDRFGASGTVQRSEVDVPVAPAKEVRDDHRFEASDGVYYLPRYRVAEETVSGTQRLRVQLREKEHGGALEVVLRRVPPPSIESSGADVQPLDHQLRLVLRSDRNGVQQEYRFQEITQKDNAVRAVLMVGDAASLLELQNALTGSQGPRLVAQRTARIAVPAEPETDATARLEKKIDQLEKQERQLNHRRRQLNKRLERARSHWQELGREDCLGYNPNNLEIRQEQDGDWLLTDGRSRMMMLKTEKDARRALALARRHTQHCFIGRGSDDRFIVGYWKGDSGIDTTIPDEVCLGYDTDNLTIEDEGDQWLLTDGNSRMLVLANRADARRALALARRHVEMCFIGKGRADEYNYVYWGARSAHHPAELELELEKVESQLQSTRRTRMENEKKLDQLQGKDYVRVTNRTFDQAIDPVPFSFPSNLEYMFPNLSGGETESGWIHHAVNGHSYYQDAADRTKFKYLPDAFRLARRPKPPYRPALRVQMLPAEDGGEPDVELTYLAVPYVDMERLDADRADLRSELPPDADEPEFKPLVATKKPAFRVSLPGSEGFTERPEASVHLRDGIDDRVRMSLKDFRTVYQSMMSDQSRLFHGEVLVDIADNTEQVDFVSDLQHLVGEVFTYDEIFDAEAGQFEARLTNTVESPLTVEAIGARVVRAGRRRAGRPATVDVLKAPGGATQLPVEIAPDETLALDVRPDELPPGDGKPDVVFDYEVKQKPDPEAIWDAIVDPTVKPTYERAVEVKTLKSIFDGGGDDGTPAIAYILVEFEQGRTVELSPETVEQTVALSFPVRDFVVSGPSGGVLDADYAFTVRVIYADGSEASSAKQTSNQELLTITNRYLP